MASLKTYEIWDTGDSMTLFPSDHPHKEFLTAGGTILKKFEATSWDEATDQFRKHIPDLNPKLTDLELDTPTNE